MVRAYQVLLHAPLSRVRCFDKTEFGGEHGCPRRGGGAAPGSAVRQGEDIAHDLRFHFVPGVHCPHSRTGEESAQDVDADRPQTLDPEACMHYCGEQPWCMGFDLLWAGGKVVCFFRDGPQDESCIDVGGPDPRHFLPSLNASASPSVPTDAPMVGTTTKLVFEELPFLRELDCAEFRAVNRADGHKCWGHGSLVVLSDVGIDAGVSVDVAAPAEGKLMLFG